VSQVSQLNFDRVGVHEVISPEGFEIHAVHVGDGEWCYQAWGPRWSVTEKGGKFFIGRFQYQDFGRYVVDGDLMSTYRDRDGMARLVIGYFYSRDYSSDAFEALAAAKQACVDIYNQGVGNV